MLECFLPTHSLIFSLLKASPDEIFWFWWDRRIKSNLSVVDSIDKLKLVTSWPRSVAMKHFIIDKTNWPEIWLVGISLVVEDLRGHVEWGSHNWVEDGLVSIIKHSGKSKITNLQFPILNEYIGRFEISMHDIKFIDIFESFHDIFEERKSLWFWQTFSSLQVVS